MNDTNNKFYTTQLQAGLSLIDETKTLLKTWENKMTASELYEIALQSGNFANRTSRRLKNIVSECFKPRYLVNNGEPAKNLKYILDNLTDAELLQFLLLFTCRANLILRDFISEVYWNCYAGGYTEISNFHAENFINNSLNEGKTEKKWEVSTIKRQTSYLIGCCMDFGLLEKGRSVSKKIKPFYLSEKIKLYLSYELYFAGLSNDQIVNHNDWAIFGLSRSDVLNEFKNLSMMGYFTLQSGGGLIDISWKKNNMEEVLDVISR